MELIHHIVLKRSDPNLAEYQRAGVMVGSGPLGISVVDISENDSRWPEVAALVEKFEPAVDMVFTQFTDSELHAADYLSVRASWHNGYPQPEDDFGFLQTTYDLAAYCDTCGTGARQVAPFRIRRPPAWGRRSFFGLNWVFDELFTKPEVWKKHFEPLGIGCREVLQHKTGEVIDSVVQLEITEVVDLNVTDPRYETCKKCDRKKFHPNVIGFRPKPERTEVSAFRSSQYFGSGHEARRLVLFAKEVFEGVYKAGLKGIDFSACAK
jgi:hypothetical protein